MRLRMPAPLAAEEMCKIMDATIAAMVPRMGRMTEVMIETQRRIAANLARPQTAEKIAKLKEPLRLVALGRLYARAGDGDHGEYAGVFSGDDGEVD